jgi:cytochrome b
MQYSPNEELLLFAILSLYLILMTTGIISSSSAFISG